MGELSTLWLSRACLNIKTGLSFIGILIITRRWWHHLIFIVEMQKSGNVKDDPLYSQVLLRRFNISLFFIIIPHCSTVTDSEHKWKFVFTKNTPYLALMGELWGVYCENLGENWLFYTILQWLMPNMSVCIHKKHPISHPDGRAMGCLLWEFGRKLTILYYSTVTDAEHECLYSQKTPHISPWWASYGVSIVRIW